MTKRLLYITANPKSERESLSKGLGRKFIESYKQQNPDYIIEELDLYQKEIPFLNTEILEGMEALHAGKNITEFPDRVRCKLEVVHALQEQFLAADRYVLASPLWNHSVPAILRAYIDLVCTIGKTFIYTEKGPVGLLNNRKVLHIQTAGGIYSQGEARQMEHGLTYTRSLFSFIGVIDFTPICVEGVDAFPGKAEEIEGKALLEVERIAKIF